MSDDEFIDRLNSVFIKYGIVLIEYDLIVLDESGVIDNRRIFKKGQKQKYDLFLYNEINKRMIMVFETIESMINEKNGQFSIFSYFETMKNMIHNSYNPIVSKEFIDFILGIKGKTKEEIILKLQLMGYKMEKYVEAGNH